MNRPRRQNIAFIVVVCLRFDCRVAASNEGDQTREGDKIIQFSDEFVDFLQNMGSRVYKYKQKHEEPYTTEGNCIFPLEEDADHKKSFQPTQGVTQKGLNDILLMKLVSFYENKYNLSGVEEIAPAEAKVEASMPPRAVSARRQIVELRAIKMRQDDGPDQLSEVQEIIVI